MAIKSEIEIVDEVRERWEEFSNLNPEEVDWKIEDRKKEFYFAKQRLEQDLVNDLHFLQVLREEVRKQKVVDEKLARGE